MPALDQRAFRDALGCFATGVTVVCARAADGEPLGLTVNSFTSVSLEPPLVLWCLAESTQRFNDYRRCGHYAISVLSADQRNLSDRFASPLTDKFAGVDWRPGVGGAPLLAGALATFECVNAQRYPGGDHLIFVGEVRRFTSRAAQPLLYVGGRYAGVAEAPAVVETSDKRLTTGRPR